MGFGLKYYSIFVFLLVFATAFEVSGQGEKTLVNPEQPAEQVSVGHIFFSGNKKTRDAILLREIPFVTGDRYTLSDLIKKFETARRQLLNTALFTEVFVAAKDITGSTIDILIDVKERNYIFPLPYFRPVDRNLNQWLVEKHASLNRVNYGAKLYYNNVTGNNDKLRIGFSAGYTKQISFSYDRLYFDKKMKWGLKLAFARGKNHELNYNTVNDKQVFIKEESHYVRTFSNTSVQFTYRPAIKTRHSFGIGYATETISDTVLALNPAYFKSGRKRINFPGIYYNLSYFNLDYIPYPTKGYAIDFTIGKSGFDHRFHIWQAHVKALASWPVSDLSFISANMYAGIKLPFRQPYFNQRLFGYNDIYMQGYEYYVVDGAAGAYLKAAFNRRLFDFNVKTPSRRKSSSVSRIPFGVFGKIFGNTGYVYNPEPGENSLSNKMLWSGGIGLDIVTWYDITVKLEWSFNALGQNGLFLHRKTTF